MITFHWHRDIVISNLTNQIAHCPGFSIDQFETSAFQLFLSVSTNDVKYDLYMLVRD